MPFPNFHSARVKDPGLFQKGSMRTIKLPGSNVTSIIGRLQGQTATTTQSYRFPKASYTAAQARAWLKKNNVKYTAFEPALRECSPGEAFELLAKSGYLKEVAKGIVEILLGPIGG